MSISRHSKLSVKSPKACVLVWLLLPTERMVVLGDTRFQLRQSRIRTQRGECFFVYTLCILRVIKIINNNMEKISTEYQENLMQEALLQAKKAYELGEVPVGAVISYNNEIISRAHNEVEKDGSVSRHAEILAIERASKYLENWRLNECILAVTLEPCTMCAGAIKLARIPTVIYALDDPRLGAFNSLFNLAQDKRLGPVPRVISGILESDSKKLLQNFFREKR